MAHYQLKTETIPAFSHEARALVMAAFISAYHEPCLGERGMLAYKLCAWDREICAEFGVSVERVQALVSEGVFAHGPDLYYVEEKTTLKFSRESGFLQSAKIWSGDSLRAQKTEFLRKLAARWQA
jgi:hypothetical protein